MMGLNIPDDMEGRVIEEMFEPPIQVGTEATADIESAHDADETVYSQEEEELLTQRLMDLGYLE